MYLLIVSLTTVLVADRRTWTLLRPIVASVSCMDACIDTLICSYSEFFLFQFMHGFGTTNCETSGTPEFSKSLWEQFYLCLFHFLFYVYAALESCFGSWKPCGRDAAVWKVADIFGVFQAAYMGSNFSKTAEVCFSEFRMRSRSHQSRLL